MRSRRPNRKRSSGKKWATGKHALAISDRSGFRYPYREMIFEPGTNLFIHRSESDGMWNRVDHPQNFPADTREAIGLKNAHPDVRDPSPPFIFTEDGSFIIFDTSADFQPVMIPD